MSSLAALERHEENLLDLVADGGLVAAKVRDRLAKIAEERARVQAELAQQRPALDAGADLVRAALDLLEDPQELYRQTTDRVRRQLNQTLFERLYIDDAGVVEDDMAEPFGDFMVRPRRVATYERRRPSPTNTKHRSKGRCEGQCSLAPTRRA